MRRAVGYGRYQGESDCALLNKLYRVLRLYTNFFQPVMKLKEKVRYGAHVTKRYYEAQTPYARVLASPDIAEEIKEELRSIYKGLNPVTLKKEITRFQGQLLRRAARNTAGMRISVQSAA